MRAPPGLGHEESFTASRIVDASCRIVPTITLMAPPRSKYRNAMKRKTKIIDENELFKMLRDSNKGAPPKASAGSTPTAKDAAGAATGKVGQDDLCTV